MGYISGCIDIKEDSHCNTSLRVRYSKAQEPQHHLSTFT